ncbi:MAG TPA: DEAD/DEAH box helicase [Myxococcota bacterium]
MIILHGAYLEDRLFLWAEAAAGAARRRANGRYAFDAGFDSVARAVGSFVGGFDPAKPRKYVARAWLPTRGEHPLPSSAIIGEAPPSRAQVRLEPWSVEGLFLAAGECFDVLSAYADRSGSTHGVLGGWDLAFWVRALRLAGSLVARQRYLPGIVRRGDEYHACWEPVWLDEDADRLEQLAAQMPAVARALSPKSSDDAPLTSAVSVLGDFVRAQVDQIVRTHVDDTHAVARAAPNGRNGREIAARAGSVYERWLLALRGDESIIHGASAELGQLAEQVREWRRPIDFDTSAPFRLCFRLEEPSLPREEPNNRRARGRRNGKGRRGREALQPGQRRWYVRYLLQSRDDTSLLVPTADAWITRGRKAAALSRMGTDVHETLLASLAQAAGVCPRIEESLRSRKPSGYSLDARGAHEFLTRTAPALEQAGFGTLLPEWWTGTSTRERLSVRARVRTPEVEAESVEPTLDDLVEFDWEVCLGGQVLSGRDLEQLARLKEPIQRVRGSWVESGVDEIHAALEFWKNRKAGAVRAREIVRMALGTADMSAGIRFDGVRATGWVEELLMRLEDKSAIEAIPAPSGFTGELRGYQERGYAWLDFLRRWGLGACLADDMGLGKTIQTLVLVERERAAGEDRPVLLVCPTSVLANWEREAARFTPKLAVASHHGPERARGYDFVQWAQAHGIVLTSYALLHRDVEDLSMLQWAGVVLDEAQNIKNPDTKQSKAVRNLVSDYRIALTGTPVENHVGDLWAIMDFLNPGLLGTREQFKRSFFVPIQAYREREASRRLQRITTPFILRRLKTDRSIISDLPDKMEMKVFCTLTREQGSLYASVVDEAERKIRDAEGIERRGVILATLTKLKQVCNHPAHFLGDGSELEGRSGKLARLTEMLEEVLEAGDRSLVFTQFAEMGGLLQSHLQEMLGREVLFLHGGVARSKRDELVERFQNEAPDAPPIFVLSLKAGGLGLNLTRANHVFHFDRWWNPAVENQATDRAFRIGQQSNVQVHKYVCAGTLEERIDDMIDRKRSIAEDIVGAGEAWITELSDDELHDILALRRDAIRD